MTEYIIQGDKGGSKKPRPPKESPNSLTSVSYARLVDLVSEGEIFGLVNGANGIFLDETPANQSSSGFTWEQRKGTQDQDYLEGFPQVENEINVGVELRGDLPYTRSITNTTLSAIRINMSVPRLAQQLSNGDTVGYKVDYAVDLRVGSDSFQQILSGSFNGKQSGLYERSIRVDLPKSNSGWTIRVRRLTPNSSSDLIADVTNIKSVTEIIDAKFRYPNSAVIGVGFDAESFGGSVPRRGYHLKGRLIKVPTNYDPETRTYSGIWDGNFKVEYSNNPAWVYYDLLLHPRYGLGDRVDASQIDKWGLYQIAQYCDVMVKDGKGGLEPRFTCNLYLQKPADAYKVLQDIASIFRGITYWGAGQAVVSADVPSDPVYTYTNANVINGKFSYKGSKRGSRYSAALVSWNDPKDMYRSKVEYIQDEEAIARFGVRTVDVTAIGCSSQGQAQRVGKWMLLTNLYETETVTFSVGIEGIRARPSQVIRVADNDRAGRRIGGRIVSATLSSVVVDSVGLVEVGDDLTCILPSGDSETRRVVDVSGNTITVTPFSSIPVEQSVWAHDSVTLHTQKFRIVGISEESPLQYSITALKYVEGKYDAVDNGTYLTIPPITSIPSSVQAPPTNITLTSDWMVEQTMAITTMNIMWNIPEGAVRYDVEWRRGNNNWVYAGRTGSREIDIKGIYAGEYQARVMAYNSLDIPSPWAYSDVVVLNGKAGEPPLVTHLHATPIVFGIEIEWGFPPNTSDTLQTELRYSITNNEADAVSLGSFAYPRNTHTLNGLKAGQSFFFSARLIDRTGNVGQWSDWVLGTSSADATDILEYLTEQITKSQLGQELLGDIEKIDGISSEVGHINNQIEILQTELAGLVGAGDWDSSTTYLENSVVRFDGGLYRAIQDTPAGTPVSDTNYWEKIGDFESIGEAVAALNSQVTQLQTEVDEITGEVFSQASSLSALIASARGRRADGDKADALRGWETQASIVQRDRVEASDKEALAERLLLIDATLGETSSQISSLQQALVNETEAIATQITTLQSKVDNDISAAIQQESTARANADSALTQRIDTQESAIGDNTAAIQTTSQTLADLEGDTKAMWSVKMQVNSKGQYVTAGVGLGIENTGGILQSQFLVMADRFGILNSINGTTTSPFIVEGGQVFMNSAVIKQADITNLIVTGELKSGNFVAGQQGIRLNFVTGQFELNGNVAGQGRMTMTNQRLDVYDQDNILRVRLGKLT